MAKVDVNACDPELVNCARRAYRAYAANSDGKTFDGRPMPTWEKLTPAVQSHWCAATTEAARYATELVRNHIAKGIEREPAPLPPAPSTPADATPVEPTTAAGASTTELKQG